MENQNREHDILEINKHSKKSLFKILKTTAVFFVIVVVFLFLVWFGLSKYGEWRFNKDLQTLKIEQDKPYLEDAYGGKTPKETLDLFIAAVEKEDFDLASKYFVISKQEEWKDGLQKTKDKNNLTWLLNELKRNNNTLDYIDPTLELGDRQLYTIGDKMLITFIKYPQGNWKIQEI